MIPIPLARAAAVVCLLWSYATRAESWSSAEPGVTTRQQVLRAFGTPSRQVREPGEFILTYQRKQAPDGTRGVRFQFDTRNELLRRIEVTPARPMRRANIESLHGPACAPGSPVSEDCHEVAKGPARHTWLHYRARGLSVLVDPAQRVKRVVYVEPELPLDTRATPRADGAPASLPTASAAGTTTVTPPAPDTSGLAPAQVLPAPGTSEPATAEVLPAQDTSGLATALVVDADASPAPEGGPPPAPAAGSDGRASPAVPGASAGSTDDSLVQGWRGPDDAAGGETWLDRKQDPLALGGLFFQRAEVTGVRAQRKTSFEPSFPALADVYLDAQPSSRVRGFILGRLVFDPLQTEGGGPDTTLGQLWLKFDILRLLYVTAGRQEVRWGSSVVWSPTDFLQAPNPDPLNNLDLRTGVDMVELALPWEAMAANLSLIGTAELEGAGTDARRMRYGGGVRAEMAVGPGEVIASAVFHQSRKPRYGLDVSAAAGPVDLNAEVAWVSDSSTRLWARDGDGFVERELEGGEMLASAGISTQFELADRYRATVRLEGFYNPLGYDDRAFLPWLTSQGDFQPLFFGRYYAMGQFNIGRRGLAEMSLTLTTLANVRDSSYLSRLDFRAAPFDARTISLQSFIEVPYGERGSEFRFERVSADPSVPSSGLGVFRVGLSLLMRL